MEKYFGVIFACGLIAGLLLAPQSIIAEELNIDFNNTTDDYGNDNGNLRFNGPGGFLVTFTDDDSDGAYGGQAEGVHITNQLLGNIKSGSQSDFVLGAFDNPYSGGPARYHSSGIVANFNMGVVLVRFLDTDNDSTVKALFAFDENGTELYRTAHDTQVTFQIDTTMTGGELIHSIEFDTEPGTSGGSTDDTYFTIDNFHVEYGECMGWCPASIGGTRFKPTSDTVNYFFLLCVPIGAVLLWKGLRRRK